ncbi:MAG TPA: DinB family protein [Terracidiphilus sp.]|jgi:uncharacterized damage-inducible protein DinB|nr:DinB family protein [Terracidiphilus sp.]
MSVAQSIVSDAVAQALLAEFEQQAAVTRRYIERLPEDKLMWKPHEKSMTAGQLAYHLASVPGGVIRATESNPAELQSFPALPQPGDLGECLRALDESIAAVRQILSSFDDAAMHETWRLRVAGQQVVEEPREKFIRDIMLSHWYQHRGQFSVYLRIMGAAVPASWGPSADEPPLFMQK